MAISRTKITLPVEHKTEDRQFTVAQQNAQAPAKAVNAIPFANGSLISSEVISGVKKDGVTFTAGQTKTLTHSLGRVPVGFFSIDCYGGGGSFDRDQTATGTTSTQVKIHSVNACTAKFWVY